MTLLSGDVRLIYAHVRGGSLWRGRQTTVELWTTAILSFLRLLSSKTLEMRPALLYSDTQSIVGFSVIRKCVTLSGYFSPEILFSRRFVWL